MRLAIAIVRGNAAAKCVAASSIISPAPTKSTWYGTGPRTALAGRSAYDGGSHADWCAPISVEVRTSLTTAKERWKSWLSVVAQRAADSAARTASAELAQDLGLSEHHGVSPLATRNAWRATWQIAQRVCMRAKRAGDTTNAGQPVSGALESAGSPAPWNSVRLQVETIAAASGPRDSDSRNSLTTPPNWSLA